MNNTFLLVKMDLLITKKFYEQKKCTYFCLKMYVYVNNCTCL